MEDQTYMLRDQLAGALLEFANTPLDKKTAQRIAEQALTNVSFENEQLAHKGLNWFAKELVKRLSL
ncbi:hypothetical protein IMZ31_21465 (plasmid) [Pontibacillus sp. ALD_SL1]|uniref:hypothetical protein n=1 Tax=Pontibacillus sp. ALD_SL1 TaxID=2777185 RepID=UPI001A95F0AE|nr:hypothetical protein [Pontibacillus sp. ALD_SL1]QST02022.1 hypothetical protein IMZ31_21465 [Pontibacillus sp. ALD_SL1]